MGERGDVDWHADQAIVTHERLLQNRVKELHSSTLMMRRTAFDSAGLYDEELPHGYGEDYDWLLRASRVGSVGAVQEILADIRKDIPSWFRDRWINTATALEYLLDKHPDLRDHRRGDARILGQIAYARAAAGRAAPGRADRRARDLPLPRGTPRLARPRGRRPRHRAAPVAVRRASPRARAVVSRLPNFIYVGPDKAGLVVAARDPAQAPRRLPDARRRTSTSSTATTTADSSGTPPSSATPATRRSSARSARTTCSTPRRPPGSTRRWARSRSWSALRDPVERAWSSYLYMRKHGIGPDTFGEALRSRPELLEHGRYATGPRPLPRAVPARDGPRRPLRRPRGRPAGLHRRRDRLPGGGSACRWRPRTSPPGSPLPRPARSASPRSRGAARTGCASTTARGSWGRSSGPRSSSERSTDRLTVRRCGPRRTTSSPYGPHSPPRSTLSSSSFGLQLRESWGW